MRKRKRKNDQDDDGDINKKMKKKGKKNKNKNKNKNPVIILNDKLTIILKLIEIFDDNLNNIDDLKQFETRIGEGEYIKVLLKMLISQYNDNNNERERKEIKNMIEMKEKIFEELKGIINREIDEMIKKSKDFEKENSDPISKELMKYPVTLRKTGHVFDRLQIMQSLEYRKKCPLTNLDLEEKTNIEDYFVENYVMKSLIEKYKVNFVKRGSKLLSVIKKIHSDDLNLINKGLLIVEMYKKFEMDDKKIVEYNLQDSEEQIVTSHEVLLTFAGRLLSEIINSRLDLAKFYLKRNEHDKAKGIIQEKILKENINSLQQENALFLVIEIMKKQPTRNIRKHKRDLKIYVKDFIKVCAKNMNFERGKKMFEEFEREYFNDTSSELDILKIRASIEMNQDEKSALYLKIATILFATSLLEAETFGRLAIECNSKNIDAHLKLLQILHGYNDVGKKDEIVRKCLDLVNLHDDEENKLKYYEWGCSVDKRNQDLLNSYLRYLIEIENYYKFEELISYSDVSTRVLWSEIRAMKQKLKDQETKIEMNSRFRTRVLCIPFDIITKIYNDDQKKKSYKYELESFNGIKLTFTMGWNRNVNRMFYGIRNPNTRSILIKAFLSIDDSTNVSQHMKLKRRQVLGNYFSSMESLNYLRSLAKTYPNNKKYLEVTVGIESCFYVD